MTENDLQQELHDVGAKLDFNEYEIDAYLTVLEHGRLTASEIAEKADIPQPRVYDTVRDLSENGLVELRESRPIEVLAVDPEDTFTDIQSTLSTLVKGLSKRYTTPTRESEAVSLIRSRQTILRYLEDVINTASYELVLSLTPELLSRFEEDLIKRRNEGVTIELLLAPEADIPDPDQYDYSRIATVVRARRGITTPVVAVADGTYSIYTTHRALHSEGDRYGIILNRLELGFLVSGFLNSVVWTSAKTLIERQGDLTFPRRYATIRRCVEDLINIEDELYAATQGRDVETGEHRTISGKVVDISIGTNRETAAITIEADGELIDIGGQVASFEDIEAYEIVVDRGSEPELQSN